LINQLINQSK